MKPQHTILCNELRKLIRSGKITKIIVASTDGNVVVYKLNKQINEGEKE